MRKLLALLGVVLVFIALPFFIYKYNTIRLDNIEKNRLARAQDGGQELHSSGCGHALKNIAIEDRVLNLGQSANLKIVLINSDNEDCEATIYLNATSFKISPSSPHTLTLSPGKRIFPWNVTPTSIGPQEISFSTGLRTIDKGFFVEDPGIFTKHMMKAASFVVAFLGPIATLPWWLEWRRRRREVPATPSIILPNENRRAK